MKILLLRHGKTTMNQDGRYQGRKTDAPLCPEGRTELLRGGTLPEIGRVYVSPLLRARETAELCFPNAEQLVIPDFAEMDFGSFEGKNYREMEHDPEYRAWVDGMCRGKCPGGESMDEFIERTVNAFVPLVGSAAEAGEKTLCITAHGGTVMALLSRFGIPKRDYYDWGVKNGQGYLAEWTGSDPQALSDPRRFSELRGLHAGGLL